MLRGFGMGLPLPTPRPRVATGGGIASDVELPSEATWFPSTAIEFAARGKAWGGTRAFSEPVRRTWGINGVGTEGVSSEGSSLAAPSLVVREGGRRRGGAPGLAVGRGGGACGTRGLPATVEGAPRGGGGRTPNPLPAPRPLWLGPSGGGVEGGGGRRPMPEGTSALSGPFSFM